MDWSFDMFVKDMKDVVSDARDHQNKTGSTEQIRPNKQTSQHNNADLFIFEQGFYIIKYLHYFNVRFTKYNLWAN